MSLVVGLGAATQARHEVWQDRNSLWADVVAKSPDEWLAQMQWGSLLAQQGRFDEALASLVRASEANPRSPRPHNLRGVVLRSQGRFDEALAAHREAGRLDPGDFRAYQEAAAAAEAQGEFARAAEFWAAAHERLPDERFLLEQGRVRERAGAPDEALRLYREAAAGNARYAEPRAALGQLLLRSGRPDAAIP